MPKRHNEVRDPVHVFIHFDASEADVINSPPFQRLRSIHQLALSYLVYPGASHKRFEHSLGVMEVATRIFDVVTRQDKLKGYAEEIAPELGSSEFHYWRQVLRVAALCHDIGHLPFSHAAEDVLLPDGVDHESLTRDLIHSEYLSEVWKKIRPKPEPDDVVKLALGPEKIEKLRLDLSFKPWEAILAEMITGDVFGADRIDYLLRDSLHTGVAYGRFDHNRLIETLRIIPGAPEGGDGDESEAQLGCERGGLESAEALMLARYFMFAQVYYHRTRLAYDEHLKDFLSAWLPGGVFPTDPAEHLQYTDDRILNAIREAAQDEGAAGHSEAARILNRGHFRQAYRRRPDDVGARSIATETIAKAASAEFGEDNVRYGKSPRRPDPPNFPVYFDKDESQSSLSLSEVLGKLPTSRDEYVLVEPSIREEARKWISEHREEIINRALEDQAKEEEVEG
jgi:HD superfamily phosphohydrolase